MTTARRETNRRQHRPRTPVRRSDSAARDRTRPETRRQRHPETTAVESTTARGREETTERDRSDRSAVLARVGDLLASEAGAPLPNRTRREMAARFGTDFTGVRLHTGSRATETTAEFDAAAYTVGEDVVLGPDVDLDRPVGQWVLAHELAHVVQNRGGGRPTELVSAGAASPGEREASLAATRVLTGTPVRPPTHQPAVVATAGLDWDDVPEFVGHWANAVGAQTAALDWVGGLGQADRLKPLFSFLDSGEDVASPVARLLTRSKGVEQFSSVARSGSTAFSRLGNAAGVAGMGLAGYNAVTGATPGDRYQGTADFLASGAGVFGGPVAGAFSGGYAAGQVLDSGVGAFRDDGRKLSDIGGDALYEEFGPLSTEFLDFYDSPVDTTTDYLGEKYDDLMGLF